MWNDTPNDLKSGALFMWHSMRSRCRTGAFCYDLFYRLEPPLFLFHFLIKMITPQPLNVFYFISFVQQPVKVVWRTNKQINKQRMDGWKTCYLKWPCPFQGSHMCRRPNTFFFLFYQQLAVVAGRCLDWFSVNPDTLPGYTHISLQAPGSFSRDPPERHAE